MMVTVFLIPRLRVHGPIPAFVTVLVLAFINTHLWSAALFFSIPQSATLQALLLLLVNGVIFWLVVKLLPGIEVDGILPAIAAPVVFTVCSMLIEVYGPQIEWAKVWEQVQTGSKSAQSYFQNTETPNAKDAAPKPR